MKIVVRRKNYKKDCQILVLKCQKERKLKDMDMHLLIMRRMIMLG